MAASLGGVPTSRPLSLVNRTPEVVDFKGSALLLWSTNGYVFGGILGSADPNPTKEDLNVTLVRDGNAAVIRFQAYHSWARFRPDGDSPHGIQHRLVIKDSAQGVLDSVELGPLHRMCKTTALLTYPMLASHTVNDATFKNAATVEIIVDGGTWWEFCPG